MAWQTRQLLAGAFPLLVRPPQADAGGPAVPPRRRQRRAGAAARRLRELAHGAAAGAAGEAKEPPTRLLQGEALHGAAEDDVDSGVGLLGSESPPLGVQDSERRRRQQLTDQDEQVEEAWKREAKDLILEADSMGAMFTAAEENIDEDWLGHIDELPGNIYRIAALGTLTDQLFEKDVDPSEAFAKLVRLVGCITICLIQICGPPLLIASVYLDWGVQRDNDVSWGDWEPSFSDWAAIKTTKMLSTLFLFVFSINGLYVILQEKQSWLKIYKLFRYLKHNTPNMDVRGEPWLILGPIVNSWVILLSCVASFTILGASFSPRNVLFDALGLLFLYNLDDVDGDLGFVSTDDWDGLRLGWVYEEMVEPNYRNAEILCKEQLVYDAEDIGTKGKVVLMLYDVVSMLLLVGALVMPAVAFVTPFLEIVPDGFD